MSKTHVFDIEQFPNFHSNTFLDIETKEILQYAIHEDLNQFDEYIDFLLNGTQGMIGFNSINYDYPLIHYLLRNRRRFKKLSPEQICELLYNESQRIIQAEWSAIPYWEELIPQLDLFKIHHFDNKQKITSLKDLQIAMRWHKVQDLPYHYTHTVTKEQIPEVLEYNKNDVLSTYEFYLKSLEQIKLRKELGEEYDLPLRNQNDPGMGTQIFLKLLAEAKGVDKKEIKNLQTFRNSIELRECILPNVKFNSKEFNNLLTKLKF